MYDKKILVVDDEKAILTLIKVTLQKEGFTKVYISETGEAALKFCKENAPDLVILDIMMPQIDGFEVLKRIREFSQVPVFFLSAKDEEIDKLLGFGLGADDYITKPFSIREIVFRIKAQIKREQFIRDSIATQQKQEDQIIANEDFEINIKKGTVTRNNEVYELRAKELKLLEYFTKNPNQILSKSQIMENVWGEYFECFDNTLMVHMRKLRQMIEKNPSSPQYLVTVKGLGYKYNL